MATYYDFFSSNTVRNEPIISIPYIDAFGTGKKRLPLVLVVYHISDCLEKEKGMVYADENL